MGLVGTIHDDLHCDRDRCSLDRHALFGARTTSFPPSAIRDVRVAKRTGKSVSYSLALVDGRGAETLLSKSDRESELGESLARARAFFIERKTDRLDMVQAPPIALAGLGLLLFAAAMAIVGTAFRGRGTRRLVIDGRRITIERGLLRRSTASFPLPEVTAVEVERGTIPDPWKSRGQLDEEAGRIVIVGSEGERIALSEDLVAGTEVHQATAARLREVLGIAPVSRGFQPAEATTPSFLKPMLGMLAFAVTASVVGNVIMRAAANKTDGTLEVQCTNRCKFGGMECMPGGSWGTTLKPGVYSFEVYDSSSPTQWKTRQVTIKKGETTTFACTPR